MLFERYALAGDRPIYLNQSLDRRDFEREVRWRACSLRTRRFLIIWWAEIANPS